MHVPEYLNHWRLIVRVVKRPRTFQPKWREPKAVRCIVVDEGNPDNEIVLQWEDPDQWGSVRGHIREGDRLYVEGSLRLRQYAVEGETRAMLLNVVRRWQHDPPEDNTLNEWVLIGDARYDPEQRTLPDDRPGACLIVEWPQDNIMTTAVVYAYEAEAQETMLALGAGDRLFVVGTAKKELLVEDATERYRVRCDAFRLGLGIENDAIIADVMDRLRAPAGVMSPREGQGSPGPDG
jgi:hypothetical protein